MRKAFTTSIEENISNEFKANCAKQGFPMNKVLEMFMEAYNAGKFKVEMNSMFDYANKAMGRAYFQEENYEMALHYARLAKDKTEEAQINEHNKLNELN